jgi:HAD superfamily hydrolase (TIGR01549 family)
MATIHFGTVPFDTELILFDKDGTLLAFEQFWGYKTADGIEQLLAAIDGSGRLRADLYRSLGVDINSRHLATHSPVVTAANFKLGLIAATVLYQHGWGWLDAELEVERHFSTVFDEPPTAEMVKPLANIAQLFADLNAQGVKIGVITSDDGAPTEAALTLLGVRQRVEFLACADGPYAAKPAPDAVWAACTQFGVDRRRAVVIGDSLTDMVMGRRARAGLSVGVLTGVIDRSELDGHADLVIGSIQEIHVLTQTKV